MPPFVQGWLGQIRPPVTGDHPVPHPLHTNGTFGLGLSSKGFLYVLDNFGLVCQDRHMPQSAVDSGTPTREDEIVDAAIPVLLRFGYKKASMDSVAAAANLSRQAVYLHFSAKEALFAAVVNSLCQSTRQAAHVALWRDGLTLGQTATRCVRRDNAARVDGTAVRTPGH